MFATLSVAKYLLDLAEAEGKSLDAMKLQKLVYYAHGWHLALTEKPLLNEHVEAWRFGPVIPSLYKYFKHFGSSPVRIWSGRTDSLKDFEGNNAEIARQIVDKVYGAYSRYSAIKLSNMTHAAGTPWSKLYKENVRNVDIPDEEIKSYFERQIGLRDKS